MSFAKIDGDFPAPDDKKKRVVAFALEPYGEENELNDHMLQIIPGRVLSVSKTDAMNIQILGGTVERMTKDDKTYYDVELSEQAASTRMALPGTDDGVKVKKFIPMANPPVFQYDSREPVVVHAPQGVEIRYSLWTANEVQRATTE